MSEVTTVGLTKVDLKALRSADAICFDHYSEKGEPRRGIRAIKKVENDPWDTERTHFVPCRSHVAVYDRDSFGASATDEAKCFQMINCAQYDDYWKTIVGLLREGDEVVLKWTGANNNGYLTQAKAGGDELYRDDLALFVRRNGSLKYSFQVSTSICPNNSARMIKP